MVNNQGVTARVQFAGKKGVAGSWRVNRIDWVPTCQRDVKANTNGVPISSDHPDGSLLGRNRRRQSAPTHLGRDLFHGRGPERGSRNGTSPQEQAVHLASSFPWAEYASYPLIDLHGAFPLVM